MGRRKIEIQPITVRKSSHLRLRSGVAGPAHLYHERNRSVTFLKRKNGLFKKAYELGVLCSVDVAVIIFGALYFVGVGRPLLIGVYFYPEERPGHHHKLYQYCSTDIRDIVSRHLQYDGERDTRGPSDFSGAASKAEDAVDADDDDADEEDAPAPPPRTQNKRPKPKTTDDDMDYRGMAIPSPPISIRNLPGATSNAIPTSSARSGNGNSKGNGMHPPSSKKPRLAPSHGRSSDEDNHLTLPPPTPGSYTFPPMTGYRGGGGGGGQYGLSPTQSSSFYPPLFDPPPQQPFRSQYDPGMYQQLVRAQQQHQRPASNPNPNPFAVDWPVHATSTHHHTTQVPSQDTGGNNWLDFLSGAGLPSGGTGRDAGSTSWERGGGGERSGGGAGQGGGQRAQSGSRSSSEPGRGEDQDG
ncbi:hypothetical protein B0H15DRAFT_1022164 [Mycena belliarum]|uniref:MADS-box domain-containing protein n=1 Tax=Mycena belliarum TaxID=1033014 RepID=A0AAD6U8U6_9AGAR|nr:hypothetical protein B0H15DRAFT_1022164 [Mycena belliae]